MHRYACVSHGVSIGSDIHPRVHASFDWLMRYMPTVERVLHITRKRYTIHA